MSSIMVAVGDQEATALINALDHAMKEAETMADCAFRLHNLEGHARFGRQASVYKTLRGRWLGVLSGMKAEELIR